MKKEKKLEPKMSQHVTTCHNINQLIPL